jgi:hypothetical protein
MFPSFPAARAICLGCFAFALGFAPLVQADLFSSLGTLIGSDQSRMNAWARNPDAAFHWGDWDFIQAVGREDGAEPNQHPVRLGSEEIAASLASVRASWKGEPVPLFSSDEIERLAPALALGLAAIGPDQDLIFLITGQHKQLGAFGLKLSTTGRIFVTGGRLQLIVGTALSDGLLGIPPGGRPRQKILTASRATPSAQARLSADARLVRQDWIAFGDRTSVPSVRETPAARPLVVEVPAVPTAPAAPVPTDRLSTLERLHDQGLISDAEYAAKRKEAQVR